MRTEKAQYIETPLEKELNQLGGRKLSDLRTDEKGKFVWMADGKDGSVKYYL